MFVVYDICFSMQVPVSSLRELSFRASIPCINQQIDSIVSGDSAVPEKLKKVNYLIDQYALPKEFIESQQQIKSLIQNAATYYYKICCSGDALRVCKSFEQFSHLQQSLQNEVNGVFLKEDQRALPQLHVMSIPVYALCLLNDSMLFMPVNKIISHLGSKELCISNVQNIENNGGGALAKLHQIMVSVLNNKVHQKDFSNVKGLEFVIQSKTNYLHNYDDVGRYFNIKTDLDCLKCINDSALEYSHDFKKLVVTDDCKLTIQKLHSRRGWITYDVDERIKKICFSADDSCLFAVTDSYIYVYNFVQCIRGRLPCAGVLAMHSVQGKDLLILRSDGQGGIDLELINSMLDRVASSGFTFEDLTVITDACFSKDGKRIIMGCENGTVLVFNPKTHWLVTLSFGDGKPVTKVAFSSDNSFLTVITDYTTMHMVHFTSLSLIKEFCAEVVHTVTARYETDKLHEEVKAIRYALPMILLSLPFDGNHPKIQELCRLNSAIGWQKTFNPRELIIAASAKHHNRMLKYTQYAGVAAVFFAAISIIYGLKFVAKYKHI